ncbi:hypothetical protein AC812_15180 [Bellilinea caldifistulae]|uniref:Uncharacterized protein n=2 Tax=Bellilinea caldifistulae TaxID=360411 RepID=A0A0P6XUM1_9CHLR|nr:hypothetical protein AC812_15180 [Bellilinea caldifistulae]
MGKIPMATRNRRRLFSSLFIGIVLFWNLQAAFLFIVTPSPYISSFQLEGFSGKVLVQGFGILFLMWNIPYVFAFWNPLQNRLSLIEANLMQLIGLVGETLLQSSLPPGEAILRATAARFILFDGIGLLLLLLALWISRPFKSHSS